jgi:hypothetical protein
VRLVAEVAVALAVGHGGISKRLSAYRNPLWSAAGVRPYAAGC